MKKNTNTLSPYYARIAAFATILAFCVILLGAYTRLKDAGLGCPDWPGCYGQLTVPHTSTELQQAATLYPGEKVEPVKAWAEMVHRYFAGSLGLLIFGLTLWALIRRAKASRQQPIIIPLILALLVLFQAALGMWTVTWKLLPLVVMGHLLGGITIFALLWLLVLKTGNFAKTYPNNFSQLKVWAALGTIIVAIQIFLGGWTTANYASLACTSFPFCHGSLWPTMDFQHGFNFFSPIGTNYEGGLLAMPARLAIHMMHRYWGLLTGLYVIVLALYLIASQKLKTIGWIILLLVIIQVLLGILNIVLLLPLPIALMHNGVAALLLASMVTLLYQLFVRR